MLPGLAWSMAQAAKADAGVTCLVQNQQNLVGPVRLSLGRIAITDFSDKEVTGEKPGDGSPCSQTTKDTSVLQLLEAPINQLHSNLLSVSMELTVSYRTSRSNRLNNPWQTIFMLSLGLLQLPCQQH